MTLPPASSRLRLVQRGKLIGQGSARAGEAPVQSSHLKDALLESLHAGPRPDRSGVCLGCLQPVSWHFDLQNRKLSCADVLRQSEPLDHGA